MVDEKIQIFKHMLKIEIIMSGLHKNYIRRIRCMCGICSFINSYLVSLEI